MMFISGWMAWRFLNYAYRFVTKNAPDICCFSLPFIVKWQTMMNCLFHFSSPFTFVNQQVTISLHPMTSFPLLPQTRRYFLLQKINMKEIYLEEFQLAFSTKHAKISLEFLSFHFSHCCLFIFISRVLFKTEIKWNVLVDMSRVLWK